MKHLKPPKRNNVGFVLSPWASEWMDRRDPWLLRLSELAGFDPEKAERWAWMYTVDELAVMYMDFRVHQESAYDQLKQ